jgi:trehalose-phosphatase
VADIYFAGNHGLEIEGPDVERVHPGAAETRPVLARMAAELRRDLPALPGVIVEDKGLTLSVHYRMVQSEADGALIREHVRRHAAAQTGVTLTEGKKVVEIRPEVEWDKGRAFAFLRRTIESVHGRGPAVFIGDDRTDEDVFRVLGQTDCSVIVGDPPQHTSCAQTVLPSTTQVAEFLRRLID